MKTFSHFILLLFISMVCYSHINEIKAQTFIPGTLPGTFNVSESGAATYEIPLDLPPGRNGIKPAIAIYYNSQQKNSRMMGQGWSITGFSAISRSNPTLYYNGANGPVDFIGDELLLDGQHLISKKDNEFRTELDVFSKILEKEDGQYGKYFLVYTKEGMILEYGNSPDSRQGALNNADNNPLAWHINKKTDRLGNSIDYKYEKSDSPDASVRPLEIFYTCYSTGQYGDTKILFNYVSTDLALQQTHFYEKNGQPFINTSNGLLKNIQISNNKNSTLIKEYSIIYFEHEGVCNENFIKQIDLTSYTKGVAISIKPTTFSWNFYQPVYEYSIGESDYIKSFSTFKSIGIDLDGDHIDNIAVYCSRIPDPEQWNEPPVKVITFYGNTPCDELLVSGNLRELKTVDWDDNGDDELIVVDDDGMKIFDYNVSRSALDLVYANPTGGNVYIGDLTGDAISEILVVMDSKLRVFVGTHSPAGNFGYELSQHFLSLSVNQTIRTISDINGDGTTEILCMGNTFNSFILYSFSSENGFNNLNTFNISPWPSQQNLDKVFYTDFNGDGKTDICFMQIEENRKRTRWTCFSYGNNYMMPQKSSALYDSLLSIADINGDGRADFFKMGFSYGKINFKFYFAQPDGISTILKTSDVNWNTGFDKSEFGFAKVNANGTMGFVFLCSKRYMVDNPVDTVDREPLGPSYEILSTITLGDFGVGANVIKTITDGFEVSTKIQYTNFGTTGSIFANFPVAKARFQDLVVSETYIEGDNNQKWNRKKYCFDTPVVHLQGKGFLGYKERRIYSFQENLINISINEILVNENKYFYLFPAEHSKWSMHEEKPDKLLTEIRNIVELKVQNIGALYYSPIYIKTITKSWDNDETHSYKGIVIENVDPEMVDSYGNITRRNVLMDENETEPEPLSRCSWEQTIESTFLQANENLWLVSLPEIINNITYHKPEEANIPETYTTSKFYGYYFPFGNSFPLLEYTQTTFDNDPSSTTFKYFSYDIYGNIISESNKAYVDGHLQERKKEFEFSDEYNFRFLTRETVKAPLTEDQVFSYIYDPLTGLLLSKTDPNTIGTINFQYDELGRLTKTLLPDGTSVEQVTDWTVSFTEFIPPAAALFYSSSHKNLKNISDKWYRKYSFFDKYRREIMTVSQGFKGEYINVDTEYDEMGRKMKVFEPYFARNSKSLFTSFEYDDLGRNIRQNFPTGLSKEINFRGRTTKVTNHTSSNLSTWTETTLNIIGKEKTINDPSGSVIYSYDPAKRIRSINAEGIQTRFEYDAAGNRTQVSDPDAGQIVTTYNAFGDLLTQTDARGSQYTNTYDELGRIQTSTLIPDDIFTKYDYIKGNENGYGKIKSTSKTIRNSNETKTLFYYDEMGRQEAKFDFFEGKYFRHINEYDINTGMLKIYTYPSLYQIKYEYDEFGFLNNVVDQSTSMMLWSAPIVNERGQLTDYTLGNGLSEQERFDQYGYPICSKVTNIASNEELFSQCYTFDVETGNLMSKDELHHGSRLTENYTYDPLLNTRLSSWQIVNGAQNYTIQYLNNGNIRCKSDVTQSLITSDEAQPVDGYYSYAENAGPHAVTGIINPTHDYSEAATEQQLSYTGFNKVSSIIQFGKDRIKKSDIQYGTDDQRIKSEYFNIIKSDEIKLKTKYFFGDYEVEIDHETGRSRQLHYLHTAYGLFAIVERDMSTFVKTSYYIHADYLGNYNLITSGNGTVLEKLSFDPWGRRRNAETWDYADLPASFLFDRGYSGHEHLDPFGLINMNGRVYDPRLARFLSPDPLVQDAGNLQAHNRYSYCLNNPFKYNDPSGYYYDDPRSGKPLGDPFNGSSENAFAFLDSGAPNFNQGWASNMGYNSAFNNAFAASNFSVDYNAAKGEISATGVDAGKMYMYLDGNSMDDLFNQVDSDKKSKNDVSSDKKIFSTTIVNNSDKAAFVKPETNNPRYTGASWVIPPRTSRNYSIDGIATKLYKDKIFKLSDSPFGYTVVVNSDGSISVPWFISGDWKTFNQINQDYGSYPASWENIYKSAESGTFNMTEWWNRPYWWKNN